MRAIEDVGEVHKRYFISITRFLEPMNNGAIQVPSWSTRALRIFDIYVDRKVRWVSVLAAARERAARQHTIQSYAMQPILAFSSIHFPFVLLFGPLWTAFGFPAHPIILSDLLLCFNLRF
jgi:hypothetical protein